MKNILMGILVSLLAVTAVLAAGEIAVRIFYPLVANYDTEMWRYASYGKVLTDITERSHRNRPGARFDKLYGVKVDINSKGLRDLEYQYEKPRGVYRILVLGDSITFGWGVPFDETYPKRLERMLNARADGTRYEVLNTGVGNYKTRDEAIFLREEGLKYNPDMIILGYFVNDAEMNPPVRQYFLKSHSYLYGFLWSKCNAVMTRLFPGKRYLNYYKELYGEKSGTLGEFKRYAEEIRVTAEQEDTPLLVIMIPDVRQLKDYPFGGIYRYVEGLFEGGEDVTVLDLLPYFDKEADPSTYWVSKEDPHPNSKAQAVIAEAAYPVVVGIIDGRGQRTDDR